MIIYSDLMKICIQSLINFDGDVPPYIITLPPPVPGKSEEESRVAPGRGGGREAAEKK